MATTATLPSSWQHRTPYGDRGHPAGKQHKEPAPACTRCGAELGPYTPRATVSLHVAGQHEQGGLFCADCVSDLQRAARPLRRS